MISRLRWDPRARDYLVSPHLTTARDGRVGAWAAANNVEIAYTPTNSSWLNRVEAQFTALRYFALDGTDHASHKEQGSSALPVITGFGYRPGRSGHRPPQVSSAMAMNASALWKPLARAVSAASWVLMPSARPLLTA